VQACRQGNGPEGRGKASPALPETKATGRKPNFGEINKLSISEPKGQTPKAYPLSRLLGPPVEAVDPGP